VVRTQGDGGERRSPLHQAANESGP